MKPQAIAPHYFAFEQDFVDSLRCIPMVVRFKLDTCGIKLKLPQWVKLSLSEKRELGFRPCFTTVEIEHYRAYLVAIIEQRCQHQATQLPPVLASWESEAQVPEEIQEKAIEWNCPQLSLQQWIQLDILQRFALVKLSRSGHEGRNFPRAFNEFGLPTAP